MNNKTITLITSTQIISKIFKLICIKLNIELIVSSSDSSIKSSDILIYEDELFNKSDLMRYKSISPIVVIIAKENIFEYESLEFIKKPFLPSQLEIKLSRLINKNIPLNTSEQKQNDIYETTEYLSNDVNDLVDFIDTIEDNKEICSESSDINISKENLETGGVLDKEELDILHEMINDTNNEFEVKQEQNNDLEELSYIIDKAIDDVQEYDFNDDELCIVLNNYTMNELSPLLNKLNQNIIDELSAGQEIKIRLLLKNK